MNKHYLDIDYKNNCFYEYSKEAQEGFEEQTNGAGKVSYRKLYDKGVFGVLQSIGIVDTTHQGKKLIVRLLNGDDVYLAGFSLYDTRGNFDNRFVEPLITMLPNLEKEQAYRFYPWAMESETSQKKNGEPRVNYGISIKKADLDTLTASKDDSDKVLPKFVRCKKDETFDATKHLPILEFKEKLGVYRPTAVSVEAKEDFLTALLEQGLKDLGYEADTQTNTEKPKQEAKPAATKPAAKASTKKDPEPIEATVLVPGEDEQDYDDLPF